MLAPYSPTWGVRWLVRSSFLKYSILQINDETDFHPHLTVLRPASPNLPDTLQLSPWF